MADNIVGQIALELGINTEDFKRQMRSLGTTTKSSVNGITDSLKKIAPVVAAAFSVKAIVGFTKECLSLGSDLAEVQNVVDVTFGEMSGAVNDWAKNAMTSFGLSEKVAKEYVGQLGAMSKAFGNSTQEAYNQATELAGLVGDVASFYNLSTDEAFTKLKAVYTGETEALKSLGVVMTQAALDEYALAQGYGKTTKAMTEQEKVALRLAFVTDRLSGASGDFVRTSDGWANQTRVLALRFDALKASIGQGLINALLPVVRVLNTILERLQVVADSFSNFMGALFGNAGSTSSAISSAASGSEIISSSLGDAESSAKAIKKSLAGFDQLNILSSGSGSSGESSGGSTSGGGSAGVVTPSIPDAKSVDLSFLSPITDAFKGFVKDITPFIDTLKGIFSWLYNEVLLPLGEWAATSLLPATLNAFGGAFSFINEVLLALQPMAEWLWDEFLKPLASWTADVAVDSLNGIGDGLRGIGDWVSEHQQTLRSCTGVILGFVGAWSATALLGWLGMAGGVTGALKLMTTALWENIGAKVVSKAEDMYLIGLYAKDYIVALGATIASVAKNTATWIANTAAKVASTAAEWAQIAATTAWNAICATATAVTTAFGAAMSFLTSPIGLVVIAITALIAAIVLCVKNWDTIKAAASAAWTSIKNTFSSVGAWFGEKTSAIKSKFSDAWASAKSGANSAWSSIKTTFSAMPTWFKDKFTAAWTAVKNVFSSGGKVFSGIKDGIESAFKKIVNTLIDGINRVIAVPFNAINKTLDKIRNIKILGNKPFSSLGSVSVPQIPKLATGGYVAANTPQLAIIGDNKREGEIVAPESKITEAVVAAFRQFLPLFNNGGNNKPIYLTLKLGDGTFWEGFVDYHNDIVKRTGDTPLLI